MKYNVIEKGTGRPVIMLHGLFGRASNWEGIIGRFAAGRRAIALDLPYLELDKDDCSVRFLSDYVLGFASSAGFDTAAYIGNSLGGHIALDIAIRHRKRIEHLVLTGSSGLFERGYEEDLQIHPTREYLKKKIEEIFFDKNFVTEAIVDEAYELLLNKKHKLNIVRLTKSAKSYNVKKDLRRISCPALLVWGREDTITPPSVAVEFNRHIKRSRLEFIDNCCHAPMMEYPERFAKLVLDFLNSPL